MGDQYDAIPDSGDRYAGGRLLSRIYRDIGLAAVAQALNLLGSDFDAEINRSLARGEFFLLPNDPPPGKPEITC